ncbi:uncharacterized protein ACR2FA_005527 [Aphomia sociella]
MLPLKMNLNYKLLPIKFHFFLFNAGTAPLVPYLSTYARQLGFTSGTVGLIYTILPIFGLIGKPLCGVIADRFKIQKSIFILFQILTIVGFSSIYFIPENKAGTYVQLDCNDGKTLLKSCMESGSMDECKVHKLDRQNETVLCKLNCDMSSPKMWQTVCENWHIPQYCYSSTNSIQYSSYIGSIMLQNKCAYISANNITLDGDKYISHCGIGDGFVNISQTCNLNCTNEMLSSFLGSDELIMTCLDDKLNYRFCINETLQLTELGNNMESECIVSCDAFRPWQLMELCEGWQADIASSCHMMTKSREEFPANLSFSGTVLPSTAKLMDECLYVQLDHITLPDDSIYHPTCTSKAVYQLEAELFHASCQISCNNSMLNEMFEAASESRNNTTQYKLEFWLFFLFMIMSWVSQAVVITFADAITFSLLGDDIYQYGKQRLWGSLGFGVYSLATGALIDLFSDGAHKDYTVAFILMFVYMCGDVTVSCFVKTDTTKMSMNILADIGILLSSLPTFVFMLWASAVGICTGFIWQFLFWHLEDIAATGCDGSDYIKTLQGLVIAIQSFVGEIPFLFASGYILRKVGHINMMFLVMFAYGVRFLLYSILTNAWWVLPIEILQGFTYGMFYPTMTSFANMLAPPGAETAVQGLVGAVFEGLGTSIGSLIGGQLYKSYGGWATFRWFGIGSLVFCAMHFIVIHLLKDKSQHNFSSQGNKKSDSIEHAE